MWSVIKSYVSPLVLGLVLLLVVVEVAVDIFAASSKQGRFSYGYDEASGLKIEDGQAKLYRTGGRRYRSQTFPLKSTALRVAVVGDSVPRGNGLGSSYAKQIEPALAAHGVQAQGINAAVAGQGARRLAPIVSQMIRLNSDWVVYHLNSSNEFEDEREWKRAQAFTGWSPDNWLMKSFVVRRLYEAKTEQVYWKWLPRALRASQVVSDADAEVRAMTNPQTVARWNKRLARVTAQTVEKMVASGVKVILVVQAIRDRSKPEGQRLQAIDHLEVLASSLAEKHDQVQVLSMYHLFKGENPDTLFKDGTHMKNLGHEKMAQALAQRIVQTP
ncbi:SGNH/GDSL hydrolase family protein [Magnetococcus sp. PR-3]|uniref:SGNH/GDSL hydrolase family protein n=1 Tax=Magnetococcus sp. PR-3 TaxID=3120355 RepID=UPI002FCDE675